MRKLYFTIQLLARVTALTTAVLCFSFTNLKAQTLDEDLQKAVEIYNAQRAYQEALVPGEISDDQFDDLEDRMFKGIALLEKVIKEGNAAQIRAARYFKTNFNYEYTFVLGMDGQNDLAYDLCRQIEREMSGYQAGDFPINYKYFGKDYVIKWENFAPTQAEYYTGYTEIAYNMSKYEDAIRIARLAVAHPSMTNWMKYIVFSKMLDLYDRKSSLMTEQQQIDYALQFLQSFYQLSEGELKTVADYKYATDVRALTIITDKAQKGVPAATAKTAEAALLSASAPANEKTLQLFELSYRNKLPLDASFHTAAEAYARKAASLSPAKATSVGIFAVDRLATATLLTDCAGLGAIGEKYTYWKQATKAAEYQKKQADCLDAVEKARKKAEKAARRSDRSFNLYAGTYLFPLLKSNEKRDYGAVMNFVFKKTAWEVSYLKIRNNKDNVFDLTVRDVDAKQENITRWSGYYAHVQPKFFTKSPMYTGVLLGYAQKNFDPLTANVTRDADAVVSQQTFEPKNTQYIAMINVGALCLTRGFGFDFYAGIGGAFNQWSIGNELDVEQYTIDNLVLENREKTHFSLLVRVGMTVGLNIGRGNMK